MVRKVREISKEMREGENCDQNIWYSNLFLVIKLARRASDEIYNCSARRRSAMKMTHRRYTDAFQAGLPSLMNELSDAVKIRVC